MNYYILYLIISSVGAGLFLSYYFYLHSKSRYIPPPKKKNGKLKTGASGIYKATIKRITDKKNNKEKILKLTERIGKITNSDVRGELKIPRRTAARYIDELVKDGKLHQIGKAGHNVFYCRK